MTTNIRFAPLVRAAIEANCEDRNNGRMPEDINNDRILSDIAKVIAKNKAVAFVGSGCSIPLGYPSWEGLRNELIQLCIQEYPSRQSEFNGWKRQQILFALLKCKRTLQPADYNRYIEDRFGHRSQDPKFTEEHKIICQLFHKILTLNYDPCLEHAFTSLNNQPPPFFVHHDRNKVANFIQTESPVIFYVHGRFNNPEECIVTLDDYKAYYQGRQDVIQTLKSLFQTRTVIFIGFGLTDAFLMSIPDELVRIFKDLQEQSHYAIMPYPRDVQPDSKREELRTTHNVNAVFYNVIGDDHYTPRLELLKRLKQLVEQEQRSMQGT